MYVIFNPRLIAYFWWFCDYFCILFSSQSLYRLWKTWKVMEFNISKFSFKNTKNLKLVAVESYGESQILANNFIINSSLFGPFSEFL